MTGCAACRSPPAARTCKRTIELARAAQARVVLVGMMIPPNYGPRYGAGIPRHVRGARASNTSSPFVPFLLDKVALNPGSCRTTASMPNAKGQPQMLENLWPKLKPLLVAPRETRKLACDTVFEGSSWKNIGSSRIRRAFAPRSM